VLDWLGSVQIRQRSGARVELQLTRGTTLTGWGIAALGGWLVLAGAMWMVALGFVALACGLLLGTLRRTLVFDRDDGLLRIQQRIFGIRRRAAIPLFHLRAVVVAAHGGKYVAYVERRIGGSIHLDEARKPKPLLEVAEAIAEVAELRLVYDATTKLAASD
jgi:hypothetical protein